MLGNWGFVWRITDKEFRVPHLMERKWHEMIEAFLKLTQEERVAEAERRLDKTLDRMPVKKLLKIVVTTHVFMMDGGGNYEIRETRENGNTNCI